MKRLIPLTLASLILSALSLSGQGGNVSNIAIGSSAGRPVILQNAQVRVCNWSAAPVPVPCSTSGIHIYSAFTLVAPYELPNPFAADMNGNYTFKITPGRYTIQISGSGLGTFSQDAVVPGDPSVDPPAIISGPFIPGGCVQAVTASTLGTPSASACGTGGGGGSPGGTNTAIQFNNSSAFGGDAANFSYNSATHAITTTGDSIAARFIGNLNTITPSTTPVFNAAVLFNNLTLGQNVSSSTINSLANNQLYELNLCQNTTSAFTFTYPTGFSQAPISPLQNNSCLNGLFWNNGGAITLAAEPHTGAPGNVYVAYNGNDSNDGLTLATAKLTVVAGLQACPHIFTLGRGCTVHIYGNNGKNGTGSVQGSATAFNSTNGLWLCAGGDPGCTGAGPGTDWFGSGSSGPIMFKGEAGYAFGSNTPAGGQVVVTGCSASDTTRPLLWITGNNAPISWENIDWGGGQCAAPVKIGVPIGGGFSGSGAVAIKGSNFRITPSRNSSSTGPGMTLANNIFWLWFDHVTCDANTAAAVTSDSRACILANPGAGAGVGDIHIEHTVFNGGGGIKEYQGSSGSYILANDLTMESDGSVACAPIFWNASSGTQGGGDLTDLQNADCPNTTSKPTFENDGSGPGSHWTVRHAVSGNNIASVTGPATVLNVPYNQSTTGPDAQNQGGFWGDFSGKTNGGNPRIAGQTDVARRGFPLVAVPYVNLAKQISSTWTTTTGTVTGAQPAPDGTSLAAEVSTGSGQCDIRPYQVGSYTPVAGETWIAGVWARAHTPANGFGNSGTTLLRISLQNGVFAETGNGTVSAQAPDVGDGEWEWVGLRATTTSGTLGVADLSLGCPDSTHPIDYYNPILLRFAPGTISVGEAAYVKEHLQTWSETASAGDVTTQRGSRFSFGSPGTTFFGKFATAPLTADRLYTWPDKNGAVAMTSDIGSPLEPVNPQAGTTYTVLNGDLAKLVSFTNAALVAVTLPQAGAGGNFTSGWWADFQCQGLGGCVLTGVTSTIDGAANLGLGVGQGVRLASDGTNYFTQRGFAAGGAIGGSGTAATIPVWTASNTIGNGPLTFSTPSLKLTTPGAAALQVQTSTSGTSQFPSLQFLDSTGTVKSQIVSKTDGSMSIDTPAGLLFRNAIGSGTQGSMIGGTFNWSGGTITSSAGDVNAHGNLKSGDGFFTANGSGLISLYGNVVPTNGQLLVGDTSGGNLQLATLTAGANVTITNGAHSITIASTGGGGSGTVTSVDMTVPSWLAVSGNPIISTGTLAVAAATGQTTHKVLGTGATTSFGPLSLTTADLPFTYSGSTTVLGTTTGSFTPGNTVVSDASGNLIDSGTTGGTGTVTSFSAGTLSPLFTTSVATSTSTPALSFSLSTAAAHKAFMNNTGSTAAPGFQSIGTGDLPFTYTGNTTKLATSTGSLTNGNCVSIDASGNLVDSGGLCGGGGGGGSVTSVGLAASTGFTVSGSPVVGAGTLTLGMPTSWTTGDLLLGNGANSVSRLAIGGNGTSLQSNGTTASWQTAGTVSSVGSSFTGGLISIGGTNPVTTTGTMAFTVAGTSGGIPYFSGASTWASSAALGANLPVIGGGAGVAPAVGTVTGTTTKFATSTGSLASANGHFTSWDANGNLIDSGVVAGAGSCTTNCVTNNLANTFVSPGTLDLTAISVTAGLLLPASAGASPVLDKTLSFDLTAHQPVFGSNGTTQAVAGLGLAQTWTATQSFAAVNASGTVNGAGIVESGGGKWAADANGLFTKYGNAAPTNGQVLIGDTSAGNLQLASLTAGSNITITPGAHSISIAGTASGITSLATTSPITGGTITTTGTIACPLCTTAAASLTSTHLMQGAGSQATSVTDLTYATPILTLPISGSIQSLDTGTPAITFGTNVVSLSGSGSGSPIDFLSIPTYTPGSPPVVTVSAAGADTDISLNLISKGAGTVQCNGSPCTPVNGVLAVSPGVGIAHFAGSTQTVTSSAVALASADVSGILPVANGGTASATGFTSAGVVGLFSTCSGTKFLGADGACHSQIKSFGTSWGDTGGATLTSGSVVYFTVPYACTISAWNMTLDAGTATVDIWKIASGTAIPTVTNTITASALPAISTGTAKHSTTLTSWTTSVAANDIFGFQLKTIATAKFVEADLECDQ